MDTTSIRSNRADGGTRTGRPAPASITGWAVVPGSTTAAFAVRNLGFHTVHGVVPVTHATVIVSGDADQRSTLTADPKPADFGVTAVRMTLNLAAIDTANSRRDKDLRHRRLLDTEQHPELVFDCADVRSDRDRWRLDGILTAHGASTPVTVDAVLVSGPVRDHITVRATTTLDRRSLGIKAPRLMIGREVAVEVSAQFHRVSVER